MISDMKIELEEKAALSDPMVQKFIANARAPATERAYKTAWQAFCDWCAKHGHAALPATGPTCALYLAHVAHGLHDGSGRPRSMSTIAMQRAAIARYHHAAGVDSPLAHPLVVDVYAGIRRSLNRPEVRGKKPMTLETLHRIVATCSIRNRELLLFGFYSAMRRSELVALRTVDVVLTEESIRVSLIGGKTDPQRSGRHFAIPSQGGVACPVAAMRAWLAARRGSGDLLFQFRSPEMVSLILKQSCHAAGIDPSLYSAMSLRSGFVTAALAAGVPIDRVARVTGHRRLDSVLVYQKNHESAAASAGRSLAQRN